MDQKNIGRAIGKLRGCPLSAEPKEPAAYLATLETAVAAKLPFDYEILIRKMGPRQIHGVRLYDPGEIPSYVSGIWNLTGFHSNSWPALAIGSIGENGDDVGFLRSGAAFGPALYRFSHEVSWDDPRYGFATKLAESFLEFVLAEPA